MQLDEIATERANGTLRLTTRQTVQFHGIIKSNLKPAIRAMSDALLDTIAACGDVNRNVICSANPHQSTLHAEAASLARAISTHLLPQSRAWHEIWIEDERVEGGEVEQEPLYGSTYLPRKFKIAVAVPPFNDVDVFAHDVGFIAVIEGGMIVGYNVTAGGGMGMTHGEPETFPRTGDIIGFCEPDQAVDVAEKILAWQRDFGDRGNRKQARLKYTIERRGLAVFRAELEQRLGYALSPAHSYRFTGTGDALGWQRGDDGLWHYTLFVENGRITDLGPRRLLTGLRAIAHAHQGVFIITGNQNLVISNVAEADKPAIAALLDMHGLSASVGALRRNAMACVALPTCGLALAEAERYLPNLVTALEQQLTEFGLSTDDITIRMTGCPNGCARPYLAEIGLVGRAAGVYNLYLGGAFDGSRLSKLYRRDIGHDAILTALRPLFAAYAKARQPAEHFSDFVIRTGHVAATTSGPQFHSDLAPELQL
jgi:sulfite reductase (NADPH) hemoprotein beta-component